MSRPADPLARIREAVADRQAAGLRRVLRPRASDENVLELAGNDYLGLARDPRVVGAAADAARLWGAGSTGSRLVTGTTELHAELEHELAQFAGSETALVFSSGYLANLGVLTALGGPDVTIVSDAGNHASIIDACRLSGSPVVVFPHRDLDKLDGVLSTIATSHAVVVTDAVFSVDGVLAPLAAIHEISQQYQAILVVDEAHAIGVVGDGGIGAAAAAGLASASDVVRTVTLSKAFGAQGGAALGAVEVIDLLVNTARPFIFDTGLAPPSVGAALAAVHILAAEPEQATRARANATKLAKIVRESGIETTQPDAAVVPAYIGDPRRAFAAAAACLTAGVRVGCFRPPSVPQGRSCLRLTARADLTAADLERAATVLRGVLSWPS
ncbi:MAG: 8-amino-7-oxononanoate synthase [Pseudonocardiales bacterium]|nr:MAG: 8-amino-7-oxononanoate synthase [Pseudonocardiales bacterium]